MNEPKQNSTNALVLTREQIYRLTEIVRHFHEIRNFTVAVDHTGIGSGVRVSFDLFTENNSSITDTSNFKI